MDLSRVVWRKASRSDEIGDKCVEVASMPGWAALRDSKNPEGGVLQLGPVGLRDLVDSVKRRG
ncbi:DUF397 domain-containing protein [Actinomadura logoneensis]|uniref:DUF397 domain-containing protein n=1 Tax=Actinomadura logoneensis TaxID=2293572 RepID=A0A372JKC7_9ACTN|nr:DUF397 domain-containing protein [Actinomadura logoneensis]RFU40369.1 DUF397 domain-containing protein [Actinomadura logoneensis]